MAMIFPAGAKRYNWIPKLAEDEKLGTELLDLSKLPGASPMVDAAEAVVGAPGETPAVEAVEVAVESKPEDAKPEDAKPEDAKPCDCKEKAQELAEEAKEVADKAQELVELVVGEDGTVSLPGEVAEVSAPVEAPLASETAGEPDKDEKKDKGEGDKKDEEPAITASETGRFVKIAALSKENKQKLVDYWKNVLGYDPKYVQYMVTDYEK